MRTPKESKMLRMMNYMMRNPKAKLTQISRLLDIPLSTVYDLKTELYKYLKELK